MLVGAWKTPIDGLEQAAKRHRAQLHRIGGLTMLDDPTLVAGNWCCWLFGEPEDRGELAARFGFRTGSDLPTAFGRALTELGEGACELLQGRFVVAAVDRGRDRCLITRDQLGAQPLVYARAGGGVLFAAHERDLLDLLPRTPSPDRLALLQWVEGGLTPPGLTLYEGVHRVPAGHRLILDGARANVERWWRFRYEDVEDGTATELAERVREAAFGAIGRAAAGSQRPAVKLSGGLDSGCVAAGLAANGFADGRALAIGGSFSGHPESDESELIEATARQTQLPLELIAFDPNSSILAPALAHIARWRVPPVTPNLFLWQPLTARARELGVDLMLDGEGGDEMFGFAPQLIADMLRAGRLPSAWSLTGRIPEIGPDPDRHLRTRALRLYGLRPFVPSAVQRYREARRRTKASSSSSLVPRADAQALAELLTAGEKDQREGPRWWRCLKESLIDMHDLFDLGGHFRREAADEGLERRHPLLYDLQLVEVMLRLPPRAQFDPIRDRPLLREALKGRIPEAVRTRYVKSHFNPPIMEGLRTDEAGLSELLCQPDAPVRGYVAAAALDRKIGIPPDERPMRDANSLWRVAIANRWLMFQTGDGS